MAERERKPYRLTDKEINLVELCRETDYGQFIVYLENGQPVRVEALKKSLKL